MNESIGKTESTCELMEPNPVSTVSAKPKRTDAQNAASRRNGARGGRRRIAYGEAECARVESLRAIGKTQNEIAQALGLSVRTLRRREAENAVARAFEVGGQPEEGTRPEPEPACAQPERTYRPGDVVHEPEGDFQVLEVDASGQPTKVLSVSTNEIFC